MAIAETLESAPRFLGEPASRWTPSAFDDLLRWLKENGASDLKLLPRCPATARIDGKWLNVTRRAIQTSEIFEILTHLSGGQIARAQIVSGDDKDFGYEVRATEDQRRRIRFRGYAMGCRDGWSLGVEITMRVIPDRPPSMTDIGIPKALYEACLPQNGLVLFTGITGSGKTTSMASILREVNLTKPWSIGTYEQPIEFELANHPDAIGPLTQSQIPTHFANFATAARSAARRALDLALVGESRDAETLDAMFELAEMGHRVMSTVHTQSVAGTPQRIIQAFPYEKHSHASASFFATVRMVIQQRLVPRLNPETGEDAGRIALREFLEFDTGMRSKLMRARPGDVMPEVERMVRNHGLALIDDAREKHEAGLIPDLVMQGIEHEYRDREAA